MFSIATNVCLADAMTIRHTVPSWLRVFGHGLSEVVIIVDEQPPSGRIAKQHGSLTNKESLYSEIHYLMKGDSRVRYVVLDYASDMSNVFRKWFLDAKPIRCQEGTPIIAFIYAIEKAIGDIVLLTSCDMLFYDNGWVDKAKQLLQTDTLDLVEPPRFGMNVYKDDLALSTRAVLLKPLTFETRCLPIKAHRLDLVRRVHRYIKRRPPWLSLEQMLQKEKDCKRIRHGVLDNQLGFSIHVYSREYPRFEWFTNAVSMIESGAVPDEQEQMGWNLVLEAWPNAGMY